MGDLFLLSERQMARISPYFPLAQGVLRVDDRRVVSEILYAFAMVCSGRTRQKSTDRTRRSTTGSCDGADWVYSTCFSPRRLVKVPNLSGS